MKPHPLHAVILLAFPFLTGCPISYSASAPAPAPAPTFSYEIVSWNHNMPKTMKLIREDEGFCALAGVGGKFNGGGEFAKVYLNQKDKTWYFEGQNVAGFGWADILVVRIKNKTSSTKISASGT